MKLVRTKYSIDTAGSTPVPGITMAVLSDFHNGDPEPVLDMIRKDSPEVIMIPGDVILGYFPDKSERVIDRCKNVIPFLRGCAETAPAYMSVGNHECLLWYDELDALRETGVTVLDNDWCELRPAGGGQGGEDRILIGGLTSALVMSYRRFRDQYNRESGSEPVRYPYRRRPRGINSFSTESGWLDDFEREAGYKILMCHHPEYWSMREPMIRDRKIDLVLSGHAHGGQWRIAGRGIYSPGQGLLPEYTGGMHKGPYGSLIISRGLSNPYVAIPRWGNPCEAVYVELKN